MPACGPSVPGLPMEAWQAATGTLFTFSITSEKYVWIFILTMPKSWPENLKAVMDVKVVIFWDIDRLYMWEKKVCYIGKIKYPLRLQSATEPHREKKKYFVRNVKVFKLSGVFTLPGVFHVWFLTSYLLFLSQIKSQICQTMKSKSDKILHTYVRIKVVKPLSFHGQDKSLVSSCKASCLGATVLGLWSL